METKVENYTPIPVVIKAIKFNPAGTSAGNVEYKDSYTVYVNEDSLIATVRNATFIVSEANNSALFNLFEELREAQSDPNAEYLNLALKRKVKVTEIVDEKEIEVEKDGDLYINENLLHLGTQSCYARQPGRSMGMIVADIPLDDENPNREFFVLEKGEPRTDQYGRVLKAKTVKVCALVTFRPDMNGVNRWTASVGETILDALRFERNEQLNRFMPVEETINKELAELDLTETETTEEADV